MRSSHVCGRTLATSLIAFGIGLAVVPTASADPTDTDQTPAPNPVPGAPAPTRFTATTTDETPAAADACKQFSAAMNYAATNYEDFAYATAGQGDVVNYGDPTVSDSNVVGRTALRQAASVALSASATPGLQPDDRGADAVVVDERGEAPRDHGSAWRWRHPQLDGKRPQHRLAQRPNGLCRSRYTRLTQSTSLTAAWRETPSCVGAGGCSARHAAYRSPRSRHRP